MEKVYDIHDIEMRKLPCLHFSMEVVITAILFVLIYKYMILRNGILFQPIYGSTKNDLFIIYVGMIMIWDTNNITKMNLCNG